MMDVEKEPKRFYIAGDFNIELGLLCADDDEDEEIYDMYGPKCWPGCDTDPGGLQKLMWYQIMEEFDRKAVSTWCSCDDEREKAFTHKAWGPKRTDIPPGQHPGSQDGNVRDVCTQRVQAVQHVGPFSSVCCDTRIWWTGLLCSAKEKEGMGRMGSRLTKMQQSNVKKCDGKEGG